MNVKLVSLTQSLVNDPALTRDLTSEELIVYIARVSNPANQLNTDTSDKLIAYLIKNKHWSPFEMVDMTVEIVTSRGIAQQILRHRSFSFQEFSQRYAAVVDIEHIELRMQAEKNRQSSSLELPVELLHLDTAMNQHFRSGEMLYKAMLEAGVAKESARFILPIATQTKIYMKGSVRSWIHYLAIRLDEHTQLEHRQIAGRIAGLFSYNFPNISKALRSIEIDDLKVRDGKPN